ncbi:MAG: hypothetical protein A2787_02110 [Omnitrophica WOR_2 bacterium RIFCSPHIGHO2_01_FULL_48_9]|nr:MAG: hypothetical protein A3D10_01830 [Omnitrophica WOR_2 bacterium RIFCSPHIGHO2_02_FULL_48_11]OGX34409.1 MAG: hypothetical protein A2787_02110 [Omnitrophica WOR_2 bacterium RIFCSPHIGHO2_01_FULL_48_9]
MKSYYSCLDAGFVKYAPQSLQHLANGEKAKKLSGKIIFYTAEDFKTLPSHGVIKAKMDEKQANIDGIIFFTLRQFFYGGRFDYKFLKYVLDEGYEVHFAREDISVENQQRLDELFPIFYATQFVIKRDEAESSWDHITGPYERIDQEQIISKELHNVA